MKPYNVSEINKYINQQLSNDFILSNISIEGEISNFTHHFSGHMYFNLKDENSRLKCVMFKSDNLKLDIIPKEGMKVVAKGNISVYERDGIYQLYVREMEESGLGDLYKEFEKLKRKLDEEGLFKEEYKKEIPKIPKKIGVVTSATGAAIEDIITVINRRFPVTNILLYPALVQGKDAAKDLIKALKYLDKREDIDLIIFGRGGGSSEELFVFNDENLARTVFNLETPNISAVGHEIDFTIVDFVSDLRAPTPSAAAEMAVPNIVDYMDKLDNIYRKTIDIINSHIDEGYYNLNMLKKEIKYNDPSNKLDNNKQRLDNKFNEFINVFEKFTSDKKNKFNTLENRLKLVDPKLNLDKGSGILTDLEGNLLRSIESLGIDDQINITMKDGSIKAKVLEIEKVNIDEY